MNDNLVLIFGSLEHSRKEVKSLFRFPADRTPVAFILALSCLDFLLYFLVHSTIFLFCYWLIMAFPKMLICAWSHHHQHTGTFRNKSLDRILEFFYALHTGVTTHLWRLHHVLGHHLNYLDQNKDESRWKRDSGESMGEVEYSFIVALTAYYRGYKVGDRYQKVRRVFIKYTLITFSILFLLTWFNPVGALFLFILPMLTSLLLTAWTTYDHHSDLDTDDVFSASRNNVGKIYNLLTGNLGLHTAHHYKQGVHWSKLPELHEKIKSKIPPELISGTEPEPGSA